MLELRDVSKNFRGITAVENVSFIARPNEVTGYLGPNGSGKSTAMKMITGLIDIGSGVILFDGRPIQADPMDYKQRMATFQRSLIFIPISARLNTFPWLANCGTCRANAQPPESRASSISFRFTLTGTLPFRLIRKECAKRCCWPPHYYIIQISCCWTSRSPDST